MTSFAKIGVVSSTVPHRSDAAQIYVKNGYAIKNDGYRQVVFDGKGVIRPVRTLHASGKLQDRHTQQIARNGDFILRHQWHPSTWFMYQFQASRGLVEVALKDHAAILATLPKELDQWLCVPAEYAISYLPPGCGWDGVDTESSKTKVDKIRRLFKGLEGVTTTDGVNWLDEVARHARVSPSKQLELDPNNEPAPVEMQFIKHCDWVVIDATGHRELITRESTSGKWELFGMPFPKGTVQAICVEWTGVGARLGVSFKHYNI